jgi:hypothetical protein
MIAGLWTYRSYLNDSTLVGDDHDKAWRMIFGEGVFTFRTPSPWVVGGTLDMGGGYVLDIAGRITEAGAGPAIIALEGYGRDGTPTAGWQYNYHCWPGYMWPEGVKQVPSLVGTTVRVKPHNGKPAGVTASFIAVGH